MRRVVNRRARRARVPDGESRVTRLKKLERNYGLLEDLNTRPRTTYLAALRNPNGSFYDFSAERFEAEDVARIHRPVEASEDERAIVPVGIGSAARVLDSSAEREGGVSTTIRS